MSSALSTGRRSALLTRRLQRVRRRRRAAALLAAVFIIPGLLFLLDCYLERSWDKTPDPPVPSAGEFDPQLVYIKARELLEKAKSNEHRGRRGQVEEQYAQSLELMLMISRDAPGYRPELVSRDIDFLRGRLRKIQ